MVGDGGDQRGRPVGRGDGGGQARAARALGPPLQADNRHPRVPAQPARGADQVQVEQRVPNDDEAHGVLQVLVLLRRVPWLRRVNVGYQD